MKDKDYQELLGISRDRNQIQMMAGMTREEREAANEMTPILLEIGHEAFRDNNPIVTMGALAKANGAVCIRAKALQEKARTEGLTEQEKEELQGHGVLMAHIQFLSNLQQSQIGQVMQNVPNLKEVIAANPSKGSAIVAWMAFFTLAVIYILHMVIG